MPHCREGPEGGLPPSEIDARPWHARHAGKMGTLGGWYQQGAGLIVLLVAFPIVTRLLSPVEAGIWFSFLSLTALLAYVDFGFGLVFARQAAHALGRDADVDDAAPPEGDFVPLSPGRKGTAELYGAARRIYVGLAVAAAVLLVLAYECLLPGGKILSVPVPHLRSCWYALGTAGILSLSVNLYQAFLNGLGGVYLSRLLSGTYQFAVGLGTLVPLAMGQGLPGMALTAAGISLVYFAASRWVLRRAAPWLGKPAGRRPSVLALARIAAPLGFVNVGGAMISYSQVPLLAYFLGPAHVAPFYLAQRIGQALFNACLQILQPQLPFFTQRLAAQDSAGAHRILRRTLIWTSSLVLIMMPLFFFLSPYLARHLLGKQDYLDTVTLGLMTIDYACLGLTVTWAQFVLAAGRNPFAISTLVNGVLNLVLIAFLAGRCGLAALPLASLLSSLAINYWYTLFEGLRLKRRLMHSSLSPAS